MHSGEMGKLRWRCRRGSKELDILLLRYLEEHYPHAAPAEQREFRRLLDHEDTVIRGHLLSHVPGTRAAEAPDPELSRLLQKLIAR